MGSPDQPSLSTDDRAALGARLAALRVAAGYTQEAFAPLTFYGRSSIANIETGRQTAPRQFWTRCDTTLDTGDLLAAHYDQLSASRRQQQIALIAGTSEGTNGTDTPLMSSGLNPQTGAAGLLNGTRPRRPTLSYQGPVAPELAMYFMEQLPGHYRADMLLGPSRLIPTILSQASLIDELVRAADKKVRTDLLSAGVAYGALLGWLYQDAGDIERSALWRSISLDLAHRSGDPQLISYALTNKAMLAVDLQDGGAVLDYAEAALVNDSGLSPKVRVLALVHQAHGHSMLPSKDKDVVDRLLDRAAALIDQVDDEHPWGNACRRTVGYIDTQRATAYVRLGAHHAAVEMWDLVLASSDQTGIPSASARRDNGVFWARQARALASIPEPERVLEIASAAAAIAVDTGSARLQRELLEVLGQAMEWQATPAGHQLREIIAAIPTSREG